MQSARLFVVLGFRFLPFSLMIPEIARPHVSQCFLFPDVSCLVRGGTVGWWNSDSAPMAVLFFIGFSWFLSLSGFFLFCVLVFLLLFPGERRNCSGLSLFVLVFVISVADSVLRIPCASSVRRDLIIFLGMVLFFYYRVLSIFRGGGFVGGGFFGGISFLPSYLVGSR